MRIMVQSYKDCAKFIVPFFDQYVILGNKTNDYLIWREIVILMNSKAHKTSSGLNRILELKANLNKK